jgi:hypothetical protein
MVTHARLIAADEAAGRQRRPADDSISPKSRVGAGETQIISLPANL